MQRFSAVRGRLLIVSTVLLIVSLVGVITTSALPKEVEQETSLLDYEHQGRFSYLAYQKASYLFDDILPEISPETEESPETPEITEIPKSPPSAPKYPVEIIDRFAMTFTYQLVPDQDELVTRISEEVEVRVVLNKPDEEPEEVVLVPNTTQTGPFTVSFSLDASELALSPATTITATVYATMETATGPIFESFTQSLTIKSKGPLLEVEENLGSTQRASFGELSYEQIGEFDYSVRMKADSPWGGITIGPPPVIPPPPQPPPQPPPLSSKTLGPEDTIFLNLLDRMDVTFYYKLASDRPLRQVATDVEITAVLEGAELWSKTFPLLQAEKNGNFNVSFPLDLFHYLELLEIIRKETGASAESYGLSITADVHTTAETDFGPIHEVFSQTLSTALGGGTLGWNEELAQTQPGSIKETRLVPNPNKYLGLSVSGVRILTAAAAGVFFLVFLFSLVVYIRFKPLELSPLEKEALRVRKKYRERMAEATGQTPIEGEKIISLASMEDLIKVADELAKPIVHQAPSASEESHAYYVLDGATRYQYVSLSKSQASQ